MQTLQLSHNSKTKFKKQHYNTFGLNFGLPENGGTCSGATSGAGGCLDVRDGRKRATCYMAKITQIYKGVAPVLQANTDLLVGKSYDEMCTILDNTIAKFVEDNAREYWYFRFNYSGDVFSKDEARAIATTCLKYSEVTFWIYTRTHDCVEILSSAPNLATYISVDPVNIRDGLEVYEQLKERKNVAMAWMGHGDVAGIKFVVCPETSGKIKSTIDAGACSKCQLCFKHNDNIKLRNIRFNIH